MISVIVGTRPEIIKMAPIILELKKRGVDFEIVHTGQHYDFEMSQVFFDELQLPRPQHLLDVGSGTQGQQTASALMKLEDLFLRERPASILVEGDTNTVLSGALAGAKLGIDVSHVEAGLRSHDLRMPEEHNRRLTDHLSSMLFAPTEEAARNLRRENVWGKIFVTGNTVIDACLTYMPLAEKRTDVLQRVRFDRFALATAHRAENVDDPRVLANLVKIFTNCPLPVVYPIHPRTVKRLKEFALYDELAHSHQVQLMNPVGYFEFLVLMKSCELILTDSGGIQEEATAPNIRRMVFVLRRSTERPEAVRSGYAKVVGTGYKRALNEVNRFLKVGRQPSGPSPFGSGRSATKIVSILKRRLES